MKDLAHSDEEQNLAEAGKAFTGPLFGTISTN